MQLTIDEGKTAVQAKARVHKSPLQFPAPMSAPVFMPDFSFHALSNFSSFRRPIQADRLEAVSGETGEASLRVLSCLSASLGGPTSPANLLARATRGKN
jgi:hypothetical protein